MKTHLFAALAVAAGVIAPPAVIAGRTAMIATPPMTTNAAVEVYMPAASEKSE